MKRSLAPLGARFPTTLGDFRREMENLFSQALGEDRESGWLAEFQPHVNFAETDKAYEITVELPGLKPEEINVDLDRDVLTISGEKKEESEEKGKTYHRVERKYGAFRRAMTLPNAAEAAEVNAQFKDGVLMVVVPKAKTTQPTKINVAS
jgi:HSP20 family protein